MATMMAADNNNNDVDGNSATGNKVDDDDNSVTGRLLLMFLGNKNSNWKSQVGPLLLCSHCYQWESIPLET